MLTSGFLDDRRIASIRSRCADCARTLRFLSRAERTTGKPPQLRQLEPSQKILILLHGRVVLKADVTLDIRKPEGAVAVITGEPQTNRVSLFLWGWAGR